LQLETLRKSCVNFLFENHQEAFKVPKITGFNAEDLKLIIIEMEKDSAGNDLKYKESLFEAIIVWFEFDQAGRSSKFPGLLKSLPLHDLSLDFLTRIVATEKVISDSHTCSKLIIDCLNKVPSASGRYLPSKFRSSKQPIKLFCFGGRINEQYTPTVSVLDMATGEWTDSTPMLSATAYAGGVAIKNKVYLCGGQNQNRSNELQVLDCSSNSWTKLRTMSEARSQIGLAVLNEFIYVAGGANSSGSEMSSVIRYCLKTDQWHTGKAMQTGRYGHHLVELNGLLYAIGGYGKDTVERYNPQTDEWTMVASTKYVHYDAGATSHNGKI